jgi:Mg-chelatase subunit ChlD
MRYLYLLIILSSWRGIGQPITLVQEKALNNYVEYANHSADEVSAVVKRIASYYPTIHQKRAYSAPRYTCPVQPEEYYFNNALKESKSLPASMQAVLNQNLKDLREVAGQVDANCKALDTYHKLEDYKQDNYEKAVSLIRTLGHMLHEYRKKQAELEEALTSSFKKMTSTLSSNPYHQANNLMHDEVARERRFLDLWSLNLEYETHTGWPVEELKITILDTDASIKSMQRGNYALKYPASSMWTQFVASMGSVLQVKRTGLDEYNFEAKKSDEHSNQVYLDLINYFNGTLVANQNSFIQYAEQNGYFGLKTIRYFPLFVINSVPGVVSVSVTPFTDIPHVPVSVAENKTPLTQTGYETLTNYVDFINETWRQTRRLQLLLTNFNQTAARFRTYESFERKGALTFNYKDFHLPLSQYQKTINESKGLAPTLAKSLNDQTTVLLNILKELDELSAALELETKEKKYENDRLAGVYVILERQEELIKLWDQRKELLYNDVRKIYDAYPPRVPSDSWYVSGKALRDLTDLDHDGLIGARAFYQGGSQQQVSTEKIDEVLRDVIAKEYDNMKGIQKIGRNNGLCPYTPYEDLPLTSKSLSEELKALKSEVSRSQAGHPYHKVVYLYNDIVDDYNKFCELSKDVFHLKTIKQPELYSLATYQPVGNPQERSTLENSSVALGNGGGSSESGENQRNASETIRVKHDTIYIERRDTVFLRESGEDLRSMEGYATNNMILLLDVSGSMNSPEKLPLLKKSVLSLISMMRPEDEVSIIAFSQKPRALLTAASFSDDARVKKAINSLKPSGKTDGNAAVKLAYKVADENYIRGGNNRIVLATDGQFVLHDDTQELIQKFAKEDIFLSVFNFGKGAGTARALEELATLGNGNYEYISPENVDIKLISEVKAKRKK